VSSLYPVYIFVKAALHCFMSPREKANKIARKPKAIKARKGTSKRTSKRGQKGKTSQARALPPTVSNESGPPPPSSQPLYFSLPDTGPTDVAVFWDFENVKIPEWCAATKASDCLREKLLPFGRIVERKLYYDSDLDLSGFTLVDCPSRHNRKETLDKKLIVDVLFFAWERVTRGAKATVVLITCDGDYSYTLARLQDIGVYTIVIFQPDNVAQILVDVANAAMAWETDVLGEPSWSLAATGARRNPTSPPAPQTTGG
jgi:NYN domain